MQPALMLRFASATRIKIYEHIVRTYCVQNIHTELKIMQRIKNLTSAYPLSATPATRGVFVRQRHFQYLNFDIFCIWRRHVVERGVGGGRGERCAGHGQYCINANWAEIICKHWHKQNGNLIGSNNKLAMHLRFQWRGLAVLRVLNRSSF